MPLPGFARFQPFGFFSTDTFLLLRVSYVDLE